MYCRVRYYGEIFYVLSRRILRGKNITRDFGSTEIYPVEYYGKGFADAKPSELFDNESNTIELQAITLLVLEATRFEKQGSVYVL